VDSAASRWAMEVFALTVVGDEMKLRVGIKIPNSNFIEDITEGQIRPHVN